MEKNYKIVSDNNCSGCGACSRACPKHAIEMVENEQGFLYPKIDKEKCINCGLCKKICPFSLEWYKANRNNVQKIKAIKNRNNDVRENSSSGGVFNALANYIISQGGIVYGASFSNELKVEHIRVSNKKDILKLMGSKYSQSDLNNCYNNVKSDLDSNKQVLFTGTPCQIAGLRSFLKKSNDNLLLVDIICHGVPSPMIFENHISLLEKKNGKKVVDYKFRSKENGWHNHTEKVIFEDGSFDYKSKYSQAYKHLYAEHSILRLSCHSCPFASFDRVSDITIGDFWGIEKSKLKKMDDNKGVSIVLINTKKGLSFVENISEDDCIEAYDIDKNECMQSQLKKPTKISPKREKFWNDYNQRGYEYIIKKYSCCGFKNNILFKLKKFSPRGIRKFIKRTLKR